MASERTFPSIPIFSAINDLSIEANNGNEIPIIYTDIWKAFDSVPHDLLIHKLIKLGLQERNLSWLINYLRDREQRVIINAASSEPIIIESGVPQWGVPSGLFFIQYINDTTHGLKVLKASLYASDAKLFAPSRVMTQKNVSKRTWTQFQGGAHLGACDSTHKSVSSYNTPRRISQQERLIIL